MSDLTVSKSVTSAAQALAETPVFAATDTQSFVSESSRASRIGLWALGLGLGGFLLWAGLAPLDEGVPGHGTVALDTKRKVVQHASGGIIREVLVREGQVVQTGQVLMRLDAAVAKANFEQVRQRYLGFRAMESRLRAEQAGLARIDFHTDVLEASSDPQISRLRLEQEQLLSARRAGLRADLAALSEGIQGLQSQIEAMGAIRINRTNQLSLLNEELAQLRDLVKEGFAPRNRQLELERMVAETQSALAELTGNLARNRRSVAELQQRSAAREQEYRKEVQSQLVEVSREVEGDAQRFKAAKDDLQRIDIRSPADGQVIGLAYQTVGGVIGSGQRLMDVIPTDQSLMIEVSVAPHLIDRVKTGLPVDVRFSTFAHSPQLVVDGAVVSVAGDLLQDQAGTAPYYLARVTVTAEGLKKLGHRQLQAGMPVEVVFRTGERSMLTYLLSPLTRRLAASMKEE